MDLTSTPRRASRPQVSATTATHLGESFEKLMSHLAPLPEGAEPPEEPTPITHEHMRSCFFGDYMDVDAEPNERK